MPRLFISYRRADSQDISDRIHDQMTTHFGEENVFQDVTDIPLGVDFRQYLQEQIDKCDAVLVVIGPDWARIMQERMTQHNDFVRIEVESALKLKKLVVPVTVRGAPMPGELDLPEGARLLSWLNAARIRPNPDFKQDCALVAKGINNELRRRHLQSISAQAPNPDRTLNIDVDKPPPADAWRTRSLPAKNIVLFQSRYVNAFGETVNRRHPSFWLRYVILPVLLFFTSVFVTIFGLNNATLQHLLPFIRTFALISTGISLLWLRAMDWKWRSDVLIVGRWQIIAITNSVLTMTTTTSEVPLEQVDNVLSERKGVFSSLLDYGDIRVSTRGVELQLIFEGLPDVARIQSEIALHVSARRRKLTQNVDFEHT